MVCQACAADPALLTPKEAQVLVLSVPEVLQSKQRRRCPKAETVEVVKSLAYFQVRSTCNFTGSGLIGNYTVDLRTGEVWMDVDREQKISTAYLEKVRKRLMQQVRRRSE